MQSTSNPKLKTYRDLQVWQKSRTLNKEIYECFGNTRDYGFRDQICRASISIMNNLAEGYDRGSAKDFGRFLYISKGSCAEVSSMLAVALDLSYLSEETYIQLDKKTAEISRMLGGLIKAVKR